MHGRRCMRLRTHRHGHSYSCGLFTGNAALSRGVTRDSLDFSHGLRGLSSVSFKSTVSGIQSSPVRGLAPLSSLFLSLHPYLAAPHPPPPFLTPCSLFGCPFVPIGGFAPAVRSPSRHCSRRCRCRHGLSYRAMLRDITEENAEAISSSLTIRARLVFLLYPRLTTFAQLLSRSFDAVAPRCLCEFLCISRG